jgi:hypothetical protein
MKKHLIRLLIASGFAAVIAFYIALALYYLPDNGTSAQTSVASAKSAIQEGNIGVISGKLGPSNTSTGWMDVMTTQIKTSSQKDLIMTALMEVGLYTRTLVRSKLATPDTSSALAGVEVRMVIDPGSKQRIVEPGEVIFARSTQELTATFQGIIDKCLGLSNGSIVIDPICVKPEELQLVLDTMAAHAFVFVLDDLGSGVHTVKLQARIKLNKIVQTGEVEARATIGKGSFSVEEVRLVRGDAHYFVNRI